MNTKIRESKKAKRQRPSLLDEVLERRMLLYVLAAGAALAGVSGAAQVKVVFTPSNATVNSSEKLEIDLNNDGVTDFVLGVREDNFGHAQNQFARGALPPGCSGGASMYAEGANPSNGLEEGPNNGYLAALINGRKIGRGVIFKGSGLMAANFYTQSCRTFRRGSFADTTQRFLGARFVINGQVHFGWIGFRSVTVGTFGPNATLCGWAYETVPNKPIIAGSGEGAVFPPSSEMHSVGPENAHAVRAAEPTSLELLAAGHVALADWRRRNAAVTSSASPS
jgi:hypothetical protein